MKHSIKLAAACLLVSSSLFAGIPVKTISPNPPSKNTIVFYSLPSDAGVDVKVEKSTPGKVVVIIYDEYANVLLKEVSLAGTEMKKDYILNQLDNGDYTIAVTSNKKTVKKDVRVYNHECFIL
jgi:hypothetical protein